MIIEDGVTSIGNCAFCYCNSLTSITIPDSVTYIGLTAFFGSSGLTNITMLDSAAIIESWAFNGCSSLSSISIPDGITYIGQSTFGGCGNLTDITIPNSVTSIWYSAFGGCTNLTDVYYIGTEDEWNNMEIGDENKCLTSATIHYQPLKAIDFRLPTGTVAIENEAFAGIRSGLVIYVPVTVTSIADDAFPADIIIATPAGSYTDAWATEHGFTVQHQR